jgi:hypothetical protein
MTLEEEALEVDVPTKRLRGLLDVATVAHSRPSAASAVGK